MRICTQRRWADLIIYKINCSYSIWHVEVRHGLRRKAHWQNLGIFFFNFGAKNTSKIKIPANWLAFICQWIEFHKQKLRVKGFHNTEHNSEDWSTKETKEGTEREEILIREKWAGSIERLKKKAKKPQKWCQCKARKSLIVNVTTTKDRMLLFTLKQRMFKFS